MPDLSIQSRRAASRGATGGSSLRSAADLRRQLQKKNTRIVTRPGTKVRWLNEKLILIRAWWGRLAATDLIFDVEREKVIYSESVTDGTLAYRQYQESCRIHGCECVTKR